MKLLFVTLLGLLCLASTPLSAQGFDPMRAGAQNSDLSGTRIELGDPVMRFTMGAQAKRRKAFEDGEWAGAEKFYAAYIQPLAEEASAVDSGTVDPAATREFMSRVRAAANTVESSRVQTFQDFVRDQMNSEWRTIAISAGYIHTKEPRERFLKLHKDFEALAPVLGRMDEDEDRAIKGLKPAKH